jgi:hypothetical protein
MTDLNNALCLRAHVLTGWRLSHNFLIALTVLLITSRHGLHRKHRSSVTVSNLCRGHTLVCEAFT